jgi:hypothetical protein
MNEDTTPIITDENGRDTKGRFSIGNTGKPKGATNKTTKDLQKFITNFLNEKAFEIPLIWDTLDDKDKATLFLHLSKLVMPKQMTDAEQETGIRPIILNLGSGLNPDAETID